MVEAIHQTLYNPDQWSTFASGDFYDFYREIVQASGSNLALSTRSEWAPPVSKRQSGQVWPDYTFQAITCGDSINQSDIATQVVFDELVRVVQNISPMCKRLCYGYFLRHSSYQLCTVGIQFPQPCHFCHRWPARAVERFTGPWNNTLKNPIIIIGNKADPATPFLDASTVAGWLGDSATLVEQDGYGHLSLAEKSNCTQNIITNFFVNGVRPEGNGTICAIDPDSAELFPSNGAKTLGVRTVFFILLVCFVIQIHLYVGFV